MDEYNYNENNPQNENQNTENTKNQEYTAQPQDNTQSYNTATPCVNSPINGFALASVILGAAGLAVSCCCSFISIPAGIIGLVLGIVGFNRSDSDKSLSIIGIVFSSIALLFGVICLLIMFAAIFSSGSISYNDFYYDLDDFLNNI